MSVLSIMQFAAGVALVVGGLVALHRMSGRIRREDAYSDGWRDGAAHYRQRAEEISCWADLHQSEAEATRQRLAVLERRYANLQALYVRLVRERLAENVTIIYANANRRNARN